MAEKLNAKQSAFVAAYKGNATEAAIAAGYSVKTARSQGQRLLTNGDIMHAIKTRQSRREKKTIATREERQEFWTRVMLGEEKERVVVDGQIVEVPPKMADRLKAADLLGKSEGDFLDRVDYTTNGESLNRPIEELTDAELQRIARGD